MRLVVYVALVGALAMCLAARANCRPSAAAVWRDASARWRRQRDETELLEGREVIRHDPHLDDLAVAEVVEVRARALGVLARRRHPIELTEVRSLPPPANRHPVTTSDRVLVLDSEVGKGTTQALHELLGTDDAVDVRRAGDVNDDIRVEDLIGEVQLPLAGDFCMPAVSDGLDL